MTTITIPKKSITDDLIIISRKELGRLLSFAQKENNNKQKSLEVLALEAKSRKNLVGPFSNTRELFNSLNI
ncbi:MAG: hypothetical protein WCW54_01890 [Candidatus Paceibacterota bacterium]